MGVFMGSSRKKKVIVPDLIAFRGEPSEKAKHESAHGLEFLFRKPDAQFLVHLADVSPSVHDKTVLGDLLDLLQLLLLLVADVAHNLLDQVFHGNETVGASVLVPDEGEMDAPLAHLLEQYAHLFVRRHNVRLTEHTPKLERLFFIDKRQDVFKIHNADNIIYRPVIHGKTRKTFFIHYAQDVAQFASGLNPRNFRPLHHHLSYHRVGEFEHAVDQVLFRRLEYSRLAAFADKILDLIFGNESGLLYLP